jgi:hypothetical protein
MEEVCVEVSCLGGEQKKRKRGAEAIPEEGRTIGDRGYDRTMGLEKWRGKAGAGQ